jgi:tetratricopeptide (TPR) repeat protein
MYIATGADDGFLYVWHRDSAKLVQKLRGDSCIVNCVAVRQHDPALITSGIDNTVKLWEFHEPGGTSLKTKGFSLSSGASQDHGSEVESSGSSSSGSEEQDDDEFGMGLRSRMQRALEIVTSEEASRRLSEAERLRNEGNALFREKKFDQSLGMYLAGLSILAFHSPTEEYQALHRQNTILLTLNLAAAHLQLKQHREVVTRCNQVLKLDSNNVKALFRKATALVELKMLAEAEGALQRAQTLAPDEPEVTRLKDLIAQKRAEALEHERELFRRMFRS